MSKLRATPDRLRVNPATKGRTGVDEEAKVIRGFIVAESGVFKDERGKFNDSSLDRIVELGNKSEAGLKSRFTHPSLSEDGLGKFLGRAKDFTKEENAVRADLHLADSSFNSPRGNLGQYVMDLAQEDSEAFGSSLVLRADKIDELDEQGNPVRDPDGKRVPPLWMPSHLLASDVVDDPDAVHTGFLAEGELDFDNLPDHVVRQAYHLLNEQFGECSRVVVEARCNSFLQRYLTYRFGVVEEEEGPRRSVEGWRHRLRLLNLQALEVSVKSSR